MSDEDIVDLLRSTLSNDKSIEFICRNAANEIERLRADLIEFKQISSDLLVLDKIARKDIESLIKERDDARIRYCRQQAAAVKGMATPEQVAKNLNWDCFKEVE